MAIVAGSLIDNARLLLGVLAPLTGTQAIVKARFTSTGAPVDLMPGTFLIPRVNGQLRHELLFRVRPTGPGRNKRWAVPDSGTIELISNVGGARHNLAVGAELVLDPAVDGLGPTAQVTEIVQAGVDPDKASVEHLLSAIVFETAPAGIGALELFRSYVGGFPAVMVMWAGSEPADGLATSTQARGRSRAGEGVQFYSEEWVVHVVVSRSDSEAARRAQGLRLMSRVSGLLTDRQTSGGVVISNPAGIQIRRRVRAPLDRAKELGQLFQIYAIELATTMSIEREEVRAVAADLERFNINADGADE